MRLERGQPGTIHVEDFDGMLCRAAVDEGTASARSSCQSWIDDSRSKDWGVLMYAQRAQRIGSCFYGPKRFVHPDVP